MTLAKESCKSEISADLHPAAPSRAEGTKKIPVPASRDGDKKLLLLDLNQQPFD
jgi:hypothetical protein